VIEVQVDPILDDPSMSEKSATIDCASSEGAVTSISTRAVVPVQVGRTFLVTQELVARSRIDGLGGLS